MVVTPFEDINRIHSSYANSWAGEDYSGGDEMGKKNSL